MDRRTAIGLAAALPASLAGARASACSFAVEGPETYAARLPQTARLFDAWFRRDELAFLGPIMGPRIESPGPQHEDFIRRAILLNEDQEPKTLFDRLFTEAARSRRVVSMTAVGDAVFVAVDEASPDGIGPDCSGMPTLRLFLVGWRGGRPHSLRLLEETTWSGHAQTAHWSA